MNANEKTTFENLVSHMTQGERAQLLSKMRPLEGDSEKSDFESKKNSELEGDGVRLDEKLRGESIIYRFILWLRSVFSSTSSEEIYNADRVMSLYRRLNHEFPGLLDFRDKLLLGVFYEKLVELKKAADFFKPYLNEINLNPGAFFVYLGSFLVPEVTQRMNDEVDPNSFPLEREVTNELRISLLRKMDDILKEIPANNRAELYQCIVSVEWLSQFAKLPFERFISGFSGVITNSQVARFETVGAELSAFARILCNGKRIPSEALESIYLFSANEIVVASSAATDDNSRAKEFMDKASSFVAIIHGFITTVPLRLVNKVVFKNIQWQPEQFSGAEDWFVKFKEQWKRLFEQQWKRWLRAKRKSQMSMQLLENFKIDDIPLLPDRPWAEMWGGIPFRFENTAGFLYWFVSKKMHYASEPLKILLLEGQFINKENKVEFSETLNSLDETSRAMYDMAESLSRTGQTGLVFDKLAADHLRTLPAQSKIDSLIAENETKVQKMRDTFCSCVRTMKKILDGVFGEKRDSVYEGISNLASVRGGDNAEFRSKLLESQRQFEAAFSVLKELEQIDVPLETK